MHIPYTLTQHIKNTTLIIWIVITNNIIAINNNSYENNLKFLLRMQLLHTYISYITYYKGITYITNVGLWCVCNKNVITCIL